MTDMDTFNGERPQWLRLMGRLKSASMSCLRNGSKSMNFESLKDKIFTFLEFFISSSIPRYFKFLYIGWDLRFFKKYIKKLEINFELEKAKQEVDCCHRRHRYRHKSQCHPKSRWQTLLAEWKQLFSHFYHRLIHFMIEHLGSSQLDVANIRYFTWANLSTKTCLTNFSLKKSESSIKMVN